MAKSGTKKNNKGPAF